MTTPSGSLRAVRPAIDAAFERCAEARHLFYAASVVEASAAIEQHLALGHDVVCDRYWLSTAVSAASRGSLLGLGEVERALVPAHVTFLLSASHDERRARLSQRSEVTLDDRRGLEPDVERAVLEGYRRAASSPVAGLVVAIDTTGLAVEQVVERMRRHLGAPSGVVAVTGLSDLAHASPLDGTNGGRR